MKINIQNRILPLLLAVLLVPALLAVPARADDTGAFWVELLDYGYAIGYSSNYLPIENGSAHILYKNPGGGMLYYVDMLIQTDSTSFRASTNQAYLTSIDLGNGLYRVFGPHSYNRTNTDGEVYFREANGTYVEVLSFRVTRYFEHNYVMPLSGTVYDYATSPSVNTPISYTGDAPSNIVNLGSSASQVDYRQPFRADLTLDNWKGMDFIHVSLSSFCASIDSIQVVQNGQSVPSVVNYLDVHYDSGTGLALIELTLDVRQLDRLSGIPIYIQVTGHVNASNGGNFVIQRCVGSITVDPPSPLTYWFTQVGTWLTTGFNSLGETVASWGTTVANTIGTQGSYITQGITAQTNSIIEALQAQFDSLIPLLNDWSEPIPKALNSINNNIISMHNSLKTWGQKIVDALNPQADSSEFRDEVENIRDQMQDASDAMNELERPPVDDVIGSVDLDIGEGSAFAEIMGTFFENDFIVSIISGSLAFSIFGLLIG